MCLRKHGGGAAAQLRGSLSLCPKKEGGEDTLCSNRGFSQIMGLEKVCTPSHPLSPFVLSFGGSSFTLRVLRFAKEENCNSLSSMDVEPERGGVDNNLASIGLCMYNAESFHTTLSMGPIR